ncbi:MAG: hypothetical protein R3264_19300, partial [Anaerolineae bacterium]|nr:hypothetical protein [Anaerolineae bacterium]
MSKPQVDIRQLQREEPSAWTALLRRQPDLDQVTVTAVNTQSLPTSDPTSARSLVRYSLTLADHSDPITFIGKRTTRTEALFYKKLAAQIPFLAPHCWLAQVTKTAGWIILDDVPNDYTPEKWDAAAVEDIISHMTTLHALHTASWQGQQRKNTQQWLPHFIDRERKRYTWRALRAEQAVYFDEGPAALISEHAIQSAGRLAPTLLQAANGIVVMRSLGGWPGILGESHLTAAADLLDDPLPMLEPLSNLPVTLLHGNPHSYHWRLTLFQECYLLGWDGVQIGPGIYDLVRFVEQFDKLYPHGRNGRMAVRSHSPISEETIVDSYLITMKKKMGGAFDARSARQAIPAARCLHVLTTWFPYFATWFAEMPHKYAWQKVNRM